MQGPTEALYSATVGLTATVDVQAAAQLVPCLLCGAKQFTDLFDGIKRCKACRLCMVNPLGTFRGENETEDYFVNDYLPLHLANRENSLAERRAHIASIRRCFDLPERVRHLDVGCALGFMLQEAALAGWESFGVETSPFAARYAEDHTGCHVHIGNLRQAALPDSSFDVVTLMDVIEHVPDPGGMIADIHRILRPRGVLFIVTPNFGSLFVRLYGRKAYGVWPDQHVVYFQPATMQRMLFKMGFHNVVTETKDFYSENLRRLFGKNGTPVARIKTSFAPQAKFGTLRSCANQVLRHIPLGDKLIALAQKR